MKLNTFEIIYQNTDFIVINKPAGLNFHTEKEDETLKSPGVVVQLRQQLVADKLFPVHRLDKMTSGLLVFAFNLKTANEFRKMFEAKKIQKFYLGIVQDKPKKKQGWVKGDMQTARRGSWKLTKLKQNPAITQFISKAIQPKERIFLLKPYTGKTHQLRVAMKSLGVPICGDRRYQNKTEAEKEARGYLHAYAMQFKLYGQTYQWVCLPNTGERFLSKPLAQLLISWQNPWELFPNS